MTFESRAQWTQYSDKNATATTTQSNNFFECQITAKVFTANVKQQKQSVQLRISRQGKDLAQKPTQSQFSRRDFANRMRPRLYAAKFLDSHSVPAQKGKIGSSVPY